MKVAVVGAGAWGLPAATQLARRGYDVTLFEAYEIGHPYASSSGDTRLWRLSHTDPLMVRLAVRAVEAWKRLERDSDSPLLLQRGLLWRGSSAVDVAAALAAVGVPYGEVAASEVGTWFPGLRPTSADAVWQGTAGSVLAADSLRAHAQLFEAAGGRLREHTTVLEMSQQPNCIRLVSRVADEQLTDDFDTVVLAPGPRAADFLTMLGLDIALEPVLEQVSYFEGRSDVDCDWLPGFYDAPSESEPGLYSMPVPGVGYKMGLDESIRPYDVSDNNRVPDKSRTADIESRVARDFLSLEPKAMHSMVCSWTDSPDGRFIIDRFWDGRVVLACGDSGTGFKFSALFGHVLADLASGFTPDADIATFGVARLADLDAASLAKRFLQ